jgi:hypothetical protein
MPVTASLIGGGAQLLSGLVSGIVGGGQKRKGRNLLNILQYPTESIPAAVLENQQLAREMAATGLPSEQYNQAMQNIQRQQTNALKGAQDRRGGLAAVSNIQQNTNDATLNLDAKNAAMRRQNIMNLQNVNNQVGQWQDKIWDNNVKQKYIQNYNYAMGLIGAGNQNQISGIDRGLAGITTGANMYLRSTYGSDGYGNTANAVSNPSVNYNGQPNYNQYELGTSGISQYDNSFDGNVNQTTA